MGMAELRRPKTQGDGAMDRWKKGDQHGARKLLTDDSDERAEKVLQAWWKLLEQLYIRSLLKNALRPNLIVRPEKPILEICPNILKVVFSSLP